jgi:formylglycine-generating enzyme required for sulfatase activity
MGSTHAEIKSIEKAEPGTWGWFFGEVPQHRVTIARPFAVGRFEVTNREWNACVSAGDCLHKPADGTQSSDHQPVSDVNWNDAQAFVAWMSKRTGHTYRLLSEAEWEYAARAGTTTAYNWGNNIGTGNANCGGCGSRWDTTQTAPVGSFKANAWGLHDMHGNVAEWVEDCHSKNYVGAPSNGSARNPGRCEARVTRGGAFDFYPEAMRSAYRGNAGIAADTRSVTIGFRVARIIGPKNELRK